MSEYAEYYLERLRKGQDEDAFFSLIEGDSSILRALMEGFSRMENRSIRADIVRCIRQYHSPETIEFLSKLLEDPEPDVWQEALDGLVAIGGSEVIKVLQVVRCGMPAGQTKPFITEAWIEEALEQLRV